MILVYNHKVLLQILIVLLLLNIHKKNIMINPEDYIKTTGQFMKPEWRTKLFDIIH